MLVRLLEPTAGKITFEGRDITHAGRRRAAPAAPGHADHLPGPVLVAEPAAHRRPDRGDADDRQRHQAARRGQAAGAGAAGDRRAQPGALQPLPARVLRRPAPAHRHRPRARAQAEADRRRRAGLRARRVDPGAGHQPAARPADASSAWPSSSSRTTWPWSGTSASASRSCTSARSSRSAPGERDLRAARRTRTPGRCSRRCRTSTKLGASHGPDPARGRRAHADRTRRRAAGSGPGAGRRRTSAPPRNRRWTVKPSGSIAACHFPEEAPLV